jgi:hypothetical protein
LKTLQKVYEPKLAVPDKDDKELAQETHNQILKIMTDAKLAETELEHNYITLGKHIYQMQVKVLWLALGYSSWRDYFSFLQEKFGMGRTQLYSYVGTVKSLSPYVDDDTMIDMGVSKAKELKRAIDTTSKAPSEELLEKARDPKVFVQEFKQAINDEYHIKDHTEPGNWYDLRGVFFTPEEKEEWEKAIDLAKSIDPVVDYQLPEHVQLKEALLRIAQEFIGTYEPKEYDFPQTPSSSATEVFNDIFDEVNK